MATHSDHVRHSVCAVAAAHLCALTRSSDMHGAEIQSRILAIGGMREELDRKRTTREDFDEDSCLSLIASSTLLTWNAPSE